MKSFSHSLCYNETTRVNHTSILRHRNQGPSLFSMSPLSSSPTSLSRTLSPTAFFSSHSITSSSSDIPRLLLFHPVTSFRCFSSSSSSSSSRFFFTKKLDRKQTLRNAAPVFWTDGVSRVSSPHSSSFSSLPFLSFISSLNARRFSFSSSSSSSPSASSPFLVNYRSSGPSVDSSQQHPFYHPVAPLLSSVVSLSPCPLSSSLSSSSVFHSRSSSFSTSLSEKFSSSPPRVDLRREDGEEKKNKGFGGLIQNERKEREEEKEKEVENRMKMRRIRNVGIFAHIDAGKTSTTEAFLLQSKQISRKGSIDDGTTTMDFMNQVRAKKERESTARRKKERKKRQDRE